MTQQVLPGPINPPSSSVSPMDIEGTSVASPGPYPKPLARKRKANPKQLEALSKARKAKQAKREELESYMQSRDDLWRTLGTLQADLMEIEHQQQSFSDYIKNSKRMDELYPTHSGAVFANQESTVAPTPPTRKVDTPPQPTTHAHGTATSTSATTSTATGGTRGLLGSVVGTGAAFVALLAASYLSKRASTSDESIL